MAFLGASPSSYFIFHYLCLRFQVLCAAPVFFCSSSSPRLSITDPRARNFQPRPATRYRDPELTNLKLLILPQLPHHPKSLISNDSILGRVSIQAVTSTPVCCSLLCGAGLSFFIQQLHMEPFAVAVGCCLLCFNTSPTIFQSPPYNFSPGVQSLIFLAGMIGGIIGSIAAGGLTDLYAKYRSQRNNGIFEPEDRLVMLLIPLIVAPCCVLMDDFFLNCANW